MLVDMYISERKAGNHLSVLAGAQLKDLILQPDPNLRLEYMKLTDSRLENVAGASHAGGNAAYVITQIEKQGYAAHGSSITTTQQSADPAG